MKKAILLVCILLSFVLMLSSCSGKSAPRSAETSSPASATAAEGMSDTPSMLAAPAEIADSSSFDFENKDPAQEPATIRPGLLTAGEWNDNKNYDFMLNLIQTNEDWKLFEKAWLVDISKRIEVYVNDNGAPVVNAKAELLDKNENVIYSAQTDNNGVAYLFNNFKSTDNNVPAFIKVSKGNSTKQAFDPLIRKYEFSSANEQKPKSLDLMLVIDTTGSMGDELSFLKAELDNVIQQVSKDNSNINIRLSVNVYRDITDDYVVRSMPFSEKIGAQLAFLKKQSANGGGDYEEAVEQALADAIEEHDWNEDATAKLLLLVLDAPPHNTGEISDEIHRLIAGSSEKGIRIIPVASSGVDKNTEFLLRSMAMATGGTYTFLTDHSGIGESHIEPTIGKYDVELLNELIVRVINEYVK